MPDRLARLLAISDSFYRRRWWLSGCLLGAVVLLGAWDSPVGPAGWALTALLLLVVWVPALVRWTRAAASARTAFRRELSGSERD